MPLVKIHRTILALVSNEVLWADTSVAAARQSRVLSPVSLRLTLLIMSRQRLVVFSPDFGPFCEVVLRTDGVHLPLES